MHKLIGREPTLEESGFIYKKGRPVSLGDCDVMVKEYIGALRKGGGIVNGAVLSGAIQGILSAEAPHKLKSNGGDINPNSYSLIQSLYRRFKLVKRRGTSSRGVVDIEEIVGIKDKFVKEIESLILEHEIPNDLIINFDETSLPIIPASDYTMEQNKVFEHDYHSHTHSFTITF